MARAAADEGQFWRRGGTRLSAIPPRRRAMSAAMRGNSSDRKAPKRSVSMPGQSTTPVPSKKAAPQDRAGSPGAQPASRATASGGVRARTKAPAQARISAPGEPASRGVEPEVEQRRAPRFDGLPDARDLVDAEVVHHEHVAFAQRRRRERPESRWGQSAIWVTAHVGQQGSRPGRAADGGIAAGSRSGRPHPRPRRPHARPVLATRRGQALLRGRRGGAAGHRPGGGDPPDAPPSLSPDRDTNGSGIGQQPPRSKHTENG